MTTLPATIPEFSANQNLTEGQRYGTDKTLRELFQATRVDIVALESRSTSAESRLTTAEADIVNLELPSHRAIYVDQGATALGADGSRAKPYKTIQAAIDAAEAAGPAAWDGYYIHISPGYYVESLVIQKSDVHLYCPVEGGAFVQGTAGLAGLYVTNASEASLITYQASGTYSDLAAKATPEAGPQNTWINNVYFQGGAGATYAIEYLGVKGDDTANTTEFGNGVFGWISAWVVGDVFMKNVRGMSWMRGRIGGDVTLRECGNIGIIRPEITGALNVEFDGADPDGWAKGGFSAFSVSHGTVSGKVTIGEGVTLAGEMPSFGDELEVNDEGEVADLNSPHIAGALDVNGSTGDVTINRPYIEGAVTATVGRTMTLNAPHIGGTVTLDNGVGAVVFNGGEHMGALADAGGRMTHNLGTIGT